MLFAEGINICQSLIAGSFWFWFLSAVFFISVTVFTECGYGFLALLSIAVFSLIIQLFSDVNLIGYILGNPHYTIGCLFVYFLIGVLYSFGRWRLYCDDRREEYDEIKKQFFKYYDITYVDVSKTSIPLEMIASWNAFLKGRLGYNIIEEYKTGIDFNDYIDKCIIWWIMYWPFSLFWTMINNPLRNLVKYFINKLHSAYNYIARQSFDGISQDFKEKR